MDLYLTSIYNENKRNKEKKKKEKKKKNALESQLDAFT